MASLPSHRDTPAGQLVAKIFLEKSLLSEVQLALIAYLPPPF
jgi:hypothetical protein